MHRIDTPTAQKDKFGAGKNGFTRGNPQTGTPSTDLDDDYFDALQEEIVGVIEAAAIQLDKSDRGQLLKAMKKHFQASDKTLTALAGLLTGANKLPYFTGDDTADQTNLTKVGRDIIGMDTVSAVLVYLGLDDLPKTFGAAASMNVGKAPGTVAAGDDSRFSQMIGVGQTWQEVSASRASGVVYTNTTGKPIQVSICTGTARPCFMYVDSIFVSNTVVTSSGTDIGAQLYLGSVIVPNNSTYRAEAPNIISWIELR
ncbi:hypothetical protein NMD69_05345 [Edwardsiella tarda]|uniref:hypothetical protein n=1 Tax=Edwardsiella tarda TaxID=636 RepID=UPI00351BF181